MTAPPTHRFTERDDWFEQEDLGAGVFRLRERWYREDYRCNIYVISGSERDLVIDTGLGLASLREFLRPLSANPVLIASHSHYDHIGGNFEFPVRFIHPAEATFVAQPTHVNTYAGLLLKTEDFRILPWNNFRAEDWVLQSAPATGCLNEGDVLDLGSRQLTVLHTPGHSWGSICLWDSASRDIFCADTVYDGELFDFLPCSDIQTYVQTLRRLRDFPVRVAYPGHGPVLTGDQFHAVIDEYLRVREV